MIFISLMWVYTYILGLLNSLVFMKLLRVENKDETYVWYELYQLFYYSFILV